MDSPPQKKHCKNIRSKTCHTICVIFFKLIMSNFSFSSFDLCICIFFLHLYTSYIYLLYELGYTNPMFDVILHNFTFDRDPRGT